MINKLQKLWNDILQEASDSEATFKFRMIHKHGLRIGVDVLSKKKMIVFDLNDRNTVTQDILPNWAGMEISIKNNISGLDHVLVFILHEEEEHFFDFLINEMIIALDGVENKNEASTEIVNLIDRLDSFFKKYSVGMNKTAQQGLYGELYFLYQYLLQKEIEPIMALNFWRGHDRSYHDFSFHNGNIEVKTTSQKQHKTITINSELQLDDTGLTNLFLYVLNVKKLTNEGQTLNEMVNSIRDFLNERNADIMRFDHFLNQAGYFDEHNNLYDTIRYSSVASDLYKISEGFPRIITLPEGVGDISYSISLSACADYKVDIGESIKSLL